MTHLLIILVTLALTLSAQTDWYVTVDGKTIATGGTGSKASPWDLNTALRSGAGAVKPGDTIRIKGGVGGAREVYQGRYASTLTGTAAAPIKVIADGRATIDGLVITTTTSAILSGKGSTNYSFDVASTSGYSSSLPNDLMKINVQYTPPGGAQIEEAMLLRSTTPTRMLVIRGACTATGGVCRSFPIGSTVRAVDDYLKVAGAHTWFMDLEVMYSQYTRVWGTGATNPPYPNFSSAVIDRCTGCKFINMVVHDSGENGFFSSGTGQGTEFYGNIIDYNGSDRLGDRGHGHGAYLQNTQNGPIKTVAYNFFLRSFGHGVQIYGTSATYLDNFHFVGNTLLNPGAPTTLGRGGSHYIIGDAGVFSGHINKDNMSYGGALTNVDVGYGGSAAAPECTAPFITGNYYINRAGKMVLKVTCKNPTITGNTLFGALSGFTQAAFPSNTYPTALTGQKIFVHPNKYEVGRANITIYNWSNQDTASITLAGVGLAAGDSYKVQDVQNFYGPPVASGVFDGSSITVPLNNTAVTQPIGTIAVPPVVHTPKEINAFVIMTGTTNPPPPGGCTCPCPCTQQGATKAK